MAAKLRTFSCTPNKTLKPLPSVAGTLTCGLTHFVRILAHMLAPLSLKLCATGSLESMEESTINLLSLLVSIIAASISAVALIRTRKTQSKFLELEKIHAELSQRQIRELEESNKDKLRTTIDLEIVSGSLFVRNVGKSNASNINISFENDDENRIVESELKQLPIQKLKPFADYKLLGSYDTFDSPDVITVLVSWTNLDGSSGSSEEVLKCY